MVAPGWWGCLESWSAGMAQTPSQGIWGRGAALHMLTAAFSCCIRLFVGDVLLVIQSLIVTYIYYYIFDTLQLRLLPIQYFWLWNLAPLCLTPRPMVRHIKATCLRLAVWKGKVTKYFDDSPSGQLIVRKNIIFETNRKQFPDNLFFKENLLGWIALSKKLGVPEEEDGSSICRRFKQRRGNLWGNLCRKDLTREHLAPRLQSDILGVGLHLVTRFWSRSKCEIAQLHCYIRVRFYLPIRF